MLTSKPLLADLKMPRSSDTYCQNCSKIRIKTTFINYRLQGVV